MKKVDTNARLPYEPPVVKATYTKDELEKAVQPFGEVTIAQSGGGCGCGCGSILVA